MERGYRMQHPEERNKSPVAALLRPTDENVLLQLGQFLSSTYLLISRWNVPGLVGAVFRNRAVIRFPTLN
jgi:hypothetical protein